MILPIYVYGDPVLRKETQELSKDYPDLNELIKNMFDTMNKAEGVGLASPQVGRSIRLFVVNGEPLSEKDPSLKDFQKVFINPEMIEMSGQEVLYNEGCLSIPGIREEVRRNEKIRISYQDENMTEHDEYFEGKKAWIIQHEYDHLEGILFTDKLNPLTRRLLKGKFNAIIRGRAETSYKIKQISK